MLEVVVPVLLVTVGKAESRVVGRARVYGNCPGRGPENFRLPVFPVLLVRPNYILCMFL